jgi:hypothetical protein
VFQIVDKNILICRYLLGQVNYRSADEAIDYLFQRVQDTAKLRHEFVVNWALNDLASKNIVCLICENPQSDHSTNSIQAPRRSTLPRQAPGRSESLLQEDLLINDSDVDDELGNRFRDSITMLPPDNW